MDTGRTLGDNRNREVGMAEAGQEKSRRCNARNGTRPVPFCEPRADILSAGVKPRAANPFHRSSRFFTFQDDFVNDTWPCAARQQHHRLIEAEYPFGATVACRSSMITTAFAPSLRNHISTATSYTRPGFALH
ncbi:hypothetical protein MRB53_039632 [Persea americana]|nr:hypothetical protein MRB53_039632 [Persea americana]